MERAGQTGPSLVPALPDDAGQEDPVSVVKRYTIRCDLCPRHLTTVIKVYANDLREARRQARFSGWRRDTAGQDVCPVHLRGGEL